ncbi:MAG: transcription elongation factor GreA [Dehalococcoidia bacterium]|jgi:transcription elongation factor GreA
MTTKQNPSLGEAATIFLATLPPKEGETCQQPVYQFVRWYGAERPFADLIPREVADYAAQLSSLHTSYLANIETVRAFLAYARKQGWNKASLAAQLKPKKAKSNLPKSTKRNLPPPSSLTREGYDKLKAEIAELKVRRTKATEEIRRAAADKDFRENAPLDAAREEKSYIEGRLMELEAILKTATIIDENRKAAPKVSVGNSIVLCDDASGEELRYTIVSPREVDPASGKISSQSPIGKAVVGRAQGDTVEITAPVGKLRYRLVQIER